MIHYKDVFQQMDLAEAMSLLPLSGEESQTVVKGREPDDLESICLTLSPIVEASLDKMCRMAIEELDRLGGSPVRKEPRESKAAI